MPVPFPNNDTDWDAPGRPMNFLIANRAYRPQQLAEITAPTMTVTANTNTNNFILLTLSAMTVTGDTSLVGNQSSQTIQTLNPDGSVKETIVDTTAPFDPVQISNFGNANAAFYDVGTTNNTDGANPRGFWPAQVLAPVTYTASGRQGAFSAGDAVADFWVSDNSTAVPFSPGNVTQAITYNNAPANGGADPTFTINTPVSRVGAVHTSTNWRAWQGADNFTPDGSGDNPFTEPVFTNGATSFDETFTTGTGLTEWTVPADLLLNPADTDTVYTIGVHCSFTLDGETFWSNCVFTQYTFTAAPDMTNVRMLFVAGGGGGAGQGTNNSYGGGGGAGGMLEVVQATLAGDTYQISVGAGAGTQGAGGDSFMTDSSGTVIFRAIGGGNGGGGDGGSGGGGGTAFTSQPGGDPLQPTSQWGGFGFAGAAGTDTAGQCMIGGGGGGAGGAGTTGSGPVTGGTGGTGRLNNFLTGSDRGYCGGGSGGAVGDSNCGFATATASPGFGGGAGNGGNGVDGFGGGGGGAINNRDQGNGNPGGSGGNGTVCITYVAPAALYTGGSISSYTDEAGENRIVHSFDVNGTLAPA